MKPIPTHLSKLSKANAALFFTVIVLLLLYYGASFLVPLTFGAFLAALAEPVCSFLQKKTPLGKIPAALLATMLIIVVIGGLAYLLIYQLTIFADDLPLIKDAFNNFLKSLQQKLSKASGVSRTEQQEFLKERSDTIVNTIEGYLTNFLGNILMIILKLLLVFIYIFLFLLYREKLVAFVLMSVKNERQLKAKEVIQKSSRVAFAYLWGRFKVMSLLALMYIVCFWFFDVRYALLLTLFGALVTIIPYIGPFISGLIPILFFMVFSDTFTQVAIFSLVILIIQLIESYVLEPVIIGSEVDLNPLVVIIAVILGSIFWGTAGMILFVPLFAIIKVYAEHTNSLKPLAYLLSNKDSN